MELTTIAKPYAIALFELAEKQSLHTNWVAVLEVMAELINNEYMKAFIASPSVAKDAKAKTLSTLIVSLLERELSKQEVAFIELLLANKRLYAIPNILELFNELMDKNSKSKVFHITSAYELNAKQQQHIADSLSNQYGISVNIDTTVDSALVGGIVVKDGDKVTDTSIKAQVEQLKSRLSATYSF